MTWNHISVSATMSRRGCCDEVSTLITSCWPYRSAWLSWWRPELHHRQSGMARYDDACAHRCHPGIPTVAAARTSRRWGGPAPGRHHQWLCCALRYLGVDAADVVGRTVARTAIAHEPSRTSVAPWTRCGRRPGARELCRPLPAAGLHAALSTTSTSMWGLYLPGAVTEQGFGWHLLSRRRRQPGYLRVEHPARQRQHRSLRSVRAVASRLG